MKNKFWLMYLLNLSLSVILLFLKCLGFINVGVFICLLPIILFTLFLGVVMILIAKAIIKEEKEGKADGN